jgi:outer membrane receptor protein involved in Fe transport
VDLSAEYPLTGLKRGGLTLNARVDNVFDKRYDEVLNFTSPRRTILVGGRASALF